jgi:hypothetical protein
VDPCAGFQSNNCELNEKFGRFTKTLTFPGSFTEVAASYWELASERRSQMPTGTLPDGLELTEEEAYALLGLCLTSPQGLDATSERALRKLAEFCSRGKLQRNYSYEPSSYTPRELDKAGA